MPLRPAVLDHVHRPCATGSYPDELQAVLSAEMAETAAAEIADWPSYAPTPLYRLDALERELGLAAVHYKDEGARFGLASFKALGGAYAVLRLAADTAEAATGRRPSPQEVREGTSAGALSGLTVVTATDGNHGRSVAWGARMAGCRCRIYVHAEVSAIRLRAIEKLGAEVVRIDGDYDASVRLCAEEAAANGWKVVSDTSYEGYMDLPRTVMAGYSVLASEALEQLADAPPTHVFVQAGVGGLAAAVCARMWQVLGAQRPRFVVVEPACAACLLASARLDRAATVVLREETLMAGLSCGAASVLAWQVLAQGAEHFLTIGEDQVAPAMQLLAAGDAGGGRIVAGESGVPGLIALLGVCADAELRRTLNLTGDSRVLLLGCEGATDPEIYRRLVGTDPDCSEDA